MRKLKMYVAAGDEAAFKGLAISTIPSPIVMTRTPIKRAIRILALLSTARNLILFQPCTDQADGSMSAAYLSIKGSTVSLSAAGTMKITRSTPTDANSSIAAGSGFAPNTETEIF